jgi:hypothetical protein
VRTRTYRNASAANRRTNNCAYGHPRANHRTHKRAIVFISIIEREFNRKCECVSVIFCRRKWRYGSTG